MSDEFYCLTFILMRAVSLAHPLMRRNMSLLAAQIANEENT